MDAKEHALVAISRIPANSGHPLHKGTPREAFIREFLESHLPGNVAIGTGEIIDSTSRPSVQRNQYDIVIYKRSYPKLDFGGGVSGFLIESVIATVEVKSTLTESDLSQAIIAARNAKALAPNVSRTFQAGYLPPKVLNYVVAYDGPAHMNTVYGWIPKIHAALGVSIPDLPQDEIGRQGFPSPSIDGVFVMEKGFLYFDNVPAGFGSAQVRAKFPGLKWLYADAQGGNLLLLFLFIQTATQNVDGSWLNPVPYLSSLTVPNIQLGVT